MSTCIMPFNFYEPYDRDKFHEHIRTLKQAEDEKLENFLLSQIPEQVTYKSAFSDYTEVYYLRESIKLLVDKLGRSCMKTNEEENYLALTRTVNSLKNQINEAEKEKAELIDRKRDVEKKIDELDKEYSEALNEMLLAADRIK